MWRARDVLGILTLVLLPILMLLGCRIPDRTPLAEVGRDQWVKLCERAVDARSDDAACPGESTTVQACLSGTDVTWVAFEVDPDCIVELWRSCHGGDSQGLFANLGQDEEEEEDSGLPFPPVPPTVEVDTGFQCEPVGDAEACRELASCVVVPPG